MRLADVTSLVEVVEEVVEEEEEVEEEKVSLGSSSVVSNCNRLAESVAKLSESKGVVV